MRIWRNVETGKKLVKKGFAKLLLKLDLMGSSKKKSNADLFEQISNEIRTF